MAPQEHRVGCLRGASKFPGRNWFPLVFWLGDGRGRWRWLASLLPAKLSSVSQGSATVPPFVLSLPAFQAKLLTYDLPDAKSRLLLEHTLSGPSAFARQTWGLCLVGSLPLHPGSLQPVCGARTTSPPFLPSSMGLWSALCSVDSILLVFWWFSGLVGHV